MFIQRLVVLSALAVCAFGQSSTTEVVTGGLLAPSRVRLTPRGNFVIAENGSGVNRGRVSVVSSAGARRSLIEQLPAGGDPEGGISGPTDVATNNNGRMLYVLIGAGDAEVAGPTQGTSAANPKGPSSILLSSLLSFRFSAELDDIQSPFTLAAEQHQAIWDGNNVVLRNADGQTAEVEMITDIRDLVPDARTLYRASNPYSMSIRGGQAWIADASYNAILRIDLESGRMRVVRRLAPIQNTIPVGPPVVDPVPNHIEPYANGYLVISMTGFPFAEGNGRVDFLDPRTGEMQPFLYGLTMPIDIAWEERGNQRPRFYTLEFSSAFLNRPPGPGRLMVYESTAGRAVKSDLVTPTSMTIGRGGELYITELGTGRLLRVRVTQ